MFIESTEELAQNKLLLLYLINSSNKPLTNAQITEIILAKDYMNYFLVQQYLIELVESQFIETIQVDQEEFYSILSKGENTLVFFEDRLAENIKEDIDSEFNLIKKKEKYDRQIVTEFYQKESGQYVVNLKLVEMDDTLFSIYLDVSTLDQAKAICNRWKEDPNYIYQNIISLLSGEDIKSEN